MRYAKDVANLDLSNCQRWNRFLEIHYERVGKDGFSSHREVTVLYVPDISDCLPSIESWCDQWISHKKAVAERDRQLNLKNEKSGQKDDVAKDKKKAELVKTSTAKVGKKEEPSSTGNAGYDNPKVKDTQKPKAEEKLDSQEVKEKEIKKPVENTDAIGSTEDGKNVKTDMVEGTSDQKAVGAKTGKKKIIKRIIKKKVATKKQITEDPTKQNDVPDKEDVGGKSIISDVDGKKDGLSSDPPAIKTFIRKKIVKKATGTELEKNEGTNPEVKTVNESVGVEDKTMVKSEAGSSEVIEQSGKKKTVKRKVIKRVLKKKAVPCDANNKVGEDDTIKVIQPEQIKGEQDEKANENQKNEVITTDDNSPSIKPTVSSEKQEQQVEKKGDSENLSPSTVDATSIHQKASQSDNATKSNGKKAQKDDKKRKKIERKESNSKANKVVKEKWKTDELPRYPGVILQTKGSTDSKLRSVSLSLNSLLDYSNKDLEESNFELSVFAESFYEMLQYEMGCRLWTFLQKLRVKFVVKRKQGKRERQEISKNENQEGSSSKRAKTIIKDAEDIKPIKIEGKDDACQEDSNIVKEEATATQKVVDPKIEAEIEEEDPEEDPEEDAEMPDASHHQVPPEEARPLFKLPEAEKIGSDVVGDTDRIEQNKTQETAEQTPETPINHDINNKTKVAKVESETKPTKGAVDKELLQAFRFFDRNRVGHIRVEDLRVIIHNLGKFLSNRDVKELVQSALLESNTGRDDRILYEKLVKISGL
ncbi:protein SHORT ROOT IN SALT MEDIUM 1-like [Salvia divinorum]|uniref:Protein SHORT ROOT IN SALT MEDIUM 1-like n=1 Tax=Salvia divinorum TaxID=28513 RepID=A0ABD1H569_SALDI